MNEAKANKDVKSIQEQGKLNGFKVADIIKQVFQDESINKRFKITDFVYSPGPDMGFIRVNFLCKNHNISSFVDFRTEYFSAKILKERLELFYE